MFCYLQMSVCQPEYRKEDDSYQLPEEGHEQYVAATLHSPKRTVKKRGMHYRQIYVHCTALQRMTYFMIFSPRIELQVAFFRRHGCRSTGTTSHYINVQQFNYFDFLTRLASPIFNEKLIIIKTKIEKKILFKCVINVLKNLLLKYSSICIQTLICSPHPFLTRSQPI